VLMVHRHVKETKRARGESCRGRGCVILMRAVGWWGLALLLSLQAAAPAWAAKGVAALRRRCAKLEKRSLLLRAATCYALLYRKSKKMRALYKAAELHRLAADNQRSPYHEIVLRKRAIYLFGLYLKKNPGASSRTQVTLRQQRRALRRALRVGYGVVWIDGDVPDGSAPKPRYRLYKKGRLIGAGPLPMREELRPGRYLLVIRRKGHHPQRIRLVVRKNETLYHRQQLRPKDQPKPDTIERSSRAAAPASGDRLGPGSRAAGGGSGAVPKAVPYVVLGVSVLLCAVGATLAGVAATNHAAIQAEPTAPEATELFNQIGGLTVASTILVSVAAAGGVTAGILFYFAYER